MSTLRQYYKECFRRAFRGKAVGADLVTGLLTLFAIPLGLWIWPGESGAMNWLPLIIFGALYLISLVVGFEVAPYQMLRDVEKENAELRAKLDARERRQNAIARLWQLRAEGVNLRNETIQGDEENAWIRRYEAWRQRVLNDAAIVSRNLEAWLTTLVKLLCKSGRSRCSP
jgi:hypothetical protein